MIAITGTFENLHSPSASLSLFLKETPTLLQSLQRTVNVTLGEGHGGDRGSNERRPLKYNQNILIMFCFNCSGDILCKFNTCWNPAFKTHHFQLKEEKRILGPHPNIIYTSERRKPTKLEQENYFHNQNRGASSGSFPTGSVVLGNVAQCGSKNTFFIH